MNTVLILLRLSIFILSIKFIITDNENWICSFESTTRCFLNDGQENGSGWKRISSHNYADPMAFEGTFYLGGESDSSKLLPTLESDPLPGLEMCLGFHFYIKGRGIKTLRIISGLDKHVIWTFTQHTFTWNYTEIDVSSSKLYIEASSDSNVLFALDEINLREGNCSTTFSATYMNISTPDDDALTDYMDKAMTTESSKAVSSMKTYTDFNTNPMTTRLSRAVFSETAVTDESSDITLGTKNSNCCKTEASQKGVNATTPLDNSTGNRTTSEIRRTLTKVHEQVPQPQGKGVGIGLGCTTAFLVALAIVVLLIKYRIRLKDLTVRHSNNQRIAVHMDSLYDDILEEGQASRRAFTVGTCRVSYDSIPGNGEAGIYSEISPEGTNRNRNTTVSAEVTHYARTNQDMCVYNHLNEAQEGHRNTYEEFSVYNLLSKQSTSRENKTFDNEYDCSDSIKNRHDDVL